MSASTATSSAAVPTIRNAGTTPATRHKLFVNLPVADLQRSIEFFETLGFRFNTQFTDANSTCMLVGEDAYVMLLARGKFDSFARRPQPDARTTTGALYSISVDSRAAVDLLVEKALACGGAPAKDKQDFGFMYGWSFYDVDGHHWEVFWMDPAAING